MKNNKFILTAIVGTSLGTVLLPVNAENLMQLTASSRATSNEIGKIKIGMTIDRATEASGVLLMPNSAPESECRYYKPRSQPRGLALMVTKGAISRIDITNPNIKTTAGIKIGDTITHVKSVYGSRLKVQPHKYLPKGHYLVLTSKDTKDKNRIVFETDGKKVINWRFGKMPEVTWVEGCS